MRYYQGNKYILPSLKLLSQSNTRQSLATKSVPNIFVKVFIGTLRQRNSKKAMQYCPHTLERGLVSCCCRSTLHNDRSETGRTLCAVEVTHTNRSIHRGDPRYRGRPSVHRVDHRRECCIRRPLDKRRSY